MPKFNPIPIEQTTAATDLLLGLLALGLLLGLRRLKTEDHLKRKYWMAVYALLACASILGAAAHGLCLSKTANYILWYPLYLCLAGLIVFFITGALHEFGGRDLSRKAFSRLCLIAFAVYLLTAIPDWFLLFLVYEGFGMLASLAIFVSLFIRKHDKSVLWMIAGIGLTMAAAVAQALGPFQWRLIWEFDHNGLFHLIQMPGIILIFLGIQNPFQIKTK